MLEQSLVHLLGLLPGGRRGCHDYREVRETPLLYNTLRVVAGDGRVDVSCSGNRSEDAFFGWNGINADYVLGNAGPSPVYSCKC